MISSNLLPHNDDLVPIAVAAVSDTFQALCRINKQIPIAPHKVDFAQFRKKIGSFGFNLQRAINEVGRLVVKTVCHVEVSFGNRVRLIEIDRGFAAEGVFEGAELLSFISRTTSGLGRRCYRRFDSILERRHGRLLLDHHDRIIMSWRLQ